VFANSRVGDPPTTTEEDEKGEDDAEASQQEAMKPQMYEGHRNHHTVKSVIFFGPNTEYVISGSDCGRIFIWRKKGKKAASSLLC
jgi:WD repeat-containing protein 42A